MGKHLELTPRLGQIAAWVRPGAHLADVGTDHAYLPVWLTLQGRVASAIASDLRLGPLNRARDTGRRYGVEERITYRLGNGLAAVRPEECDTIVIAGRSDDYCVPCGTCRQVMMEFAPDLTVICLNKKGESRKFALKELLPYGAVLVLLTVAVMLNLKRSKYGRAIMAIRDNRIAAEAMGLNVTKYKMMAFVTSAVLAGMAGALYGLNFSTVAASKFKFDTSILVLVFVVLGGMGNILGSIISATVLYILPEAMRGLQDYRMILYAVVLIVVMLFTWSPKVKEAMSVVTDKIAGAFKKKEAGSNE